jgi:hypothetical protein
MHPWNVDRGNLKAKGSLEVIVILGEEIEDWRWKMGNF